MRAQEVGGDSPTFITV